MPSNDSTILQPAENSNKTKGVRWRARKEVLNDTIINRKTHAFHPQNLGGFSVVYTNKPGGKSLTSLVFKLFGHLPWEGVTAKVAIGCSPLIHGLLQIQLPGIHNQNI